MLARDHKNVRQQGRDLAKKLGVTPTPPKDDDSMKSYAAIMKRLNGLSGKGFDKAFLQNEVGYHDAVIGAVQKTLLPAIQDAELKDLVTKVAPARRWTSRNRRSSSTNPSRSNAATTNPRVRVAMGAADL
jgi:putative membrane protein